ncbi:hypothetical protein [Bradyrhizobium uaiense]|uniref:Apea-like HEPN domain-containing protein n=1 Tax=Bradyrhizobium uaiense TaxID=2594946 RepID=A0A6P1BCG2_9BRAD|nr:hypothetical protein [Bradyrhizobium uaiense]NEU95973.1 hypothetical protein [Bradyrhizobium uaiense]
MSIFSEIIDQWVIAETAFSDIESRAFANDDEPLFDNASEMRKRNDQAYFLYLFTRFEAAVNEAVVIVRGNRTLPSIPWPERRMWETMNNREIKNVAFLTRVEILMDKSSSDYATVKSYYDGRNKVAHGGVWDEQFVIPSIASTMETLMHGFPTT